MARQRVTHRELVELKGLLREKKLTYEKMSEYVGISVSAFSDKINGNTVFNLVELAKIVRKAEIQPEDISKYFF